MKEGELANCEADCIFFRALSPNDEILNRIAREATLAGEEFSGSETSPGSAATMCGGCVAMQRNTKDLQKRIGMLPLPRNGVGKI